ncbi:MAG: protein-glutamate O-methyltransferase [Actinoplanes sp.]
MLPFVASRQITGDEFRYLTALLHEHTGIRLAPGKEALVMGRLDKRLRQLSLHDYGEYVNLLRTGRDEAELHQLINLLTTNETYFFRESQHFEYLQGAVLPVWRANRPFRLWSAASSTGEEAYTAAMVLSEALPRSPWQILGSDISTRVIESARKAIYPLEAAEKIPPALLRRHCLRGRDEYEGLMTVSPELRAKVEFQRVNLMEDFRQLGQFDVILLRNVMIYFDLETKRDLVPRLQATLQPGGHLIIGSSETLSAIPSDLRMIQPSVYQVAGGDHV